MQKVYLGLDKGKKAVVFYASIFKIKAGKSA